MSLCKAGLVFLITVPFLDFHLEPYTICNCAFNHVFFIYCLTLQLNRKHHNGKDHYQLLSLCISDPFFRVNTKRVVWGPWAHESDSLFPPSAQAVLAFNCLCALFWWPLDFMLWISWLLCPECPSELPQMLKWHPIWGSVEKSPPPRGVLIFSQSHYSVFLCSPRQAWTSLLLRSPTVQCELR